MEIDVSTLNPDELELEKNNPQIQSVTLEGSGHVWDFDENHIVRTGSVLRAVDKTRVVSFRASTATMDRHKTIIKPDGIDTERFDGNPIFAWGHDVYGGWDTPKMENTIGRVVAHRQTAQSFDIDVEFAAEDVNPRAEMAFRMVQGGFLSAVSIGFRPKEWHEEEINGGRVVIFDRVELLEVSLVAIPSNPDALKLKEFNEYIRSAFRPAGPSTSPEEASPADAADSDAVPTVRSAVRSWIARGLVRSILRR